MDDLTRTMTNHRRVSKHPRHPESAWPSHGKDGRTDSGMLRQSPETDRGGVGSWRDSGRATSTIIARGGIRFRFVPGVNALLTIVTPDPVDDVALSCGRTRGPVAPIPQITSLDPRRPAKAFEVRKRSKGLQSAATHQIVRTALRVRINTIKNKVETEKCPSSKA